MLTLSVLVCDGVSFLIIILFVHIPIISYNVSDCVIYVKNITGGWIAPLHRLSSMVVGYLKHSSCSKHN